MKIISIKR